MNLDNMPNYAGLLPKLRTTLTWELDHTVTDSEWQYFAEEFNQRVDAMVETIFQDLVDNKDEWLDDESENAE